MIRWGFLSQIVGPRVGKRLLLYPRQLASHPKSGVAFDRNSPSPRPETWLFISRDLQTKPPPLASPSLPPSSPSGGRDEKGGGGNVIRPRRPRHRALPPPPPPSIGGSGPGGSAVPLSPSHILKDDHETPPLGHGFH